MGHASVFIALAGLGILGCGSGSEPPVEFTGRDIAPRCELKSDAPPDAVAARDALLANWTRRLQARQEREQAIEALGKALGASDADDSLLVDLIMGRVKQVGCTASCTDKALGCTMLAFDCRLAPEKQRDGDALASTINAYLPKIGRFETPGPLNAQLGRYAEPKQCDIRVSSTYRDELMFMTALTTRLTEASRQARERSCPTSQDACRSQCAAGNASSCLQASFAASTDETKLGYQVQACEGGVAMACDLAFQLANDAHPAFQARVAELMDHVCAAPSPSEACATLFANGMRQGWARSHPFFSRLQHGIADSCETMGIDVCSMTLRGFSAKEGSLLDAAAQAKLLTTLRKACEDAKPRACLALVSNALGAVMTRSARSPYLTRACDLDLQYCPIAANCFSGKCPDEIDADPAQAQRANDRWCTDVRTKIKIESALPAQCRKGGP